MDPIARLTEAGVKLATLRDRKDVLEEELKAVNKEKDELENEIIPRLMDDSEVINIKIDGVGTLFTKSEVYAYIRVDDTARAHSWLQRSGNGGIIKETIHHATLKAWAKEQLEEGVQIPDIFNVKPYRKAQLRRA